jgi:hypothetical protein
LEPPTSTFGVPNRPLCSIKQLSGPRKVDANQLECVAEHRVVPPPLAPRARASSPLCCHTREACALTVWHRRSARGLWCSEEVKAGLRRGHTFMRHAFCARSTPAWHAFASLLLNRERTGPPVPDPSRDMPRGCDNTAAKMRARGAQAGAGRTANADTTSTYISKFPIDFGWRGGALWGF